jgi:hypothetical protein
LVTSSCPSLLKSLRKKSFKDARLQQVYILVRKEMSSCIRVSTKVRQEINKFHLEEKQEKIVVRCVWGYSKPQNIHERVHKASYRLKEGLTGRRDWHRSTKVLENRKISFIPESGGNYSGTLAMNFLMLPTFALIYALEDSGKDNLKALIKKNSSH